MPLHNVLWICATIAFALGAANVPAGINWLCLGAAFAAATMWL